MIVQQEAHANPAIGGGAELLKEKRPRKIVSPNVVLKVQRAVRGAGQEDAGRECRARIEEGMNAAQPGVGAHGWGKRASEPSLFRVQDSKVRITPFEGRQISEAHPSCPQNEQRECNDEHTPNVPRALSTILCAIH